MKPESRNAIFCRLADQLRASCERRGVDLSEGVAERILADGISEVAKLLRVTDQHAMRTYFHDDTINGLADLTARARQQQDVEVELASPMVLPIPHAATVIGSLAASCQAATTAWTRTETTTTIMEATAAIVRIAGAIARASDTDPAIVDAETAVIARSQLAAAVAHLSNGSWTMPGHRCLPDARDHDLAMAQRIQSDAQLLQELAPERDW
jgi:hypothetical protein